MLLPKRVKHRKQHRGRMTGEATRGNKVTYGQFGLQATEPAWITAAQIGVPCYVMSGKTKGAGQLGKRFSPEEQFTERPADTRMGKGKGNVDYWVAVVKPGRVMFELGGVDEEVAREAMRLAANKLPIKCKFVVKEEGGEQ